jgi:hypothetical protein
VSLVLQTAVSCLSHALTLDRCNALGLSQHEQATGLEIKNQKSELKIVLSDG